MQTGKIGVTTENIFPIIKKFLYSDSDIFLRELISNAIDATQKLNTLASVGEFNGELGDLKVWVNLDKKKNTITISDRGIGMTSEEIDKYINQIAFSSAEEFLDKYKNQVNAIIGHFGLGFYSAFIVSKKVEIITKSYKEDAKAVKWACDGSPAYELEEIEKKDRGTDIILHMDDDSKDYLEENKINELLNRYCKFLPVEIAFGKKKEWKDDKEIETEEDQVINNTNPSWTRVPADLKEEDYTNFYHELYPYAEDPLFYIHLNVDYPFNLTGILYFPKIRNNMEVQKNKIQLYCNQVYVTDSVEGIVPEFLTLLHGVIDSPDIPLNVSRSYLQSDSNVKKISGHITKKVADRLQEIFKNQRDEFEKKWDDLKLFIEYGMISDEKFYERATKFALVKNVDSKYFTLEEYEKIIKENQTDKNKSLVYLYATNREEQFSYIEAAKNKGYDVLLMDGHFDAHFINQLEQKLTDSRFVRVDSDVVEKLIPKEELEETKLADEEKDDMSKIFKAQLRNKDSFSIVFETMSDKEGPVMITRSEFMRRMKEMAELGGGGMNFYGNLPDSYNLVINVKHPLIEGILKDKEEKIGGELKKNSGKLSPVKKQKEKLEKTHKDKKEEEIKQEEKDLLADIEKKITDIEKKREKVLTDYSQGNQQIKQMIDLALLSNNMLKGEELNKFVKRSIELL